VLGAFLDDSGTHVGSPFVVVGGLLGTDKQWDNFSEEWQARLKAPLPGRRAIKNFHLSHCRRHWGEFENYNDAAIDHLTYLFRHIILDSGLTTIAVAVDNVAWTDLVTDTISHVLGSPLELAFFKCLELANGLGQDRKSPESVSVCLDEGTEDRLRPFTDSCTQNRSTFPAIETVFYAPVEKVVALQGADMIATETYFFNQAFRGNPNDPPVSPHFEDFRYGENSIGLLINREILEETVSRVKSCIGQG